MIQVRRDAGARRFDAGELVRHRRYGYRGVVVAADASCRASEEWYQSNQTRPRRDQPWYHVLVHGTVQATYAAEENLVPDPEPGPVAHPLVPRFFAAFTGGRYLRNDEPWPG